MGNRLGVDIQGKKVVVKPGIYRTPSESEADRTFMAEDGFGCRTFTSGQAVIGYFVSTGTKCRIEGYEIEKLAEEEVSATSE